MVKKFKYDLDLDDTASPRTFRFDESEHRQALINNFLKTDSDVLNLVGATDPFMAQAQSMRKMMQEYNHMRAVTPTDHIARALKVEILTGVQAGVGPEQMAGSKKPRFKVYARRIGPTADMSQPASVDWCKITGKDAINKAIAQHPVYYPVPGAEQPSVGDIIKVSVFESTEFGRSNLYHGILQSELLKPRKSAQNKTNKGLRPATPENKKEPIDCKNRNKLRKKAEKFPTNKFLRGKGNALTDLIEYNGHITDKNAEKLPGSVKLFLTKLNEIAPNETRTGVPGGIGGGGKIRFTDFDRTGKDQAERMYKNWVSVAENVQGDTGRPPLSPLRNPSDWWKDLTQANVSLDKYSNKVVIGKIKGIFKDNYRNEAIKQAQALLEKTPVSKHQKGKSIDIGLLKSDKILVKQAANLGLFKILKAVAQETCSFILVEKDHFHINTDAKEFGWKKDSGLGAWADVIPPKGPPKK